MKKILVILTGGTIGSASVHGTVDVSTSAARSIEQLYYQKYGRDVDFELIQPVNTLSENITSDVWLRLCECIDGISCADYSGIVICHGSDTLSYTACLVAMLYNHLPIPIVLTAANYELNNAKSNGLVNFRSAVCLIGSGVRGVFAAYADNAGNNDIYIASRIMESDPYNDMYRSFDGRVWGRIVKDKLEIYSPPYRDELEAFSSVKTKRPQGFNKRVMLIRPYPDMSYNNIDLDGVSAVVHYMYHSATACVVGEDTSVIRFAERCAERSVRLYMASFKDRSLERAYLSSREILGKNVIPLFNISPEAAYIKALIAENSDGFDIDATLFFENM